MSKERSSARESLESSPSSLVEMPVLPMLPPDCFDHFEEIREALAKIRFKANQGDEIDHDLNESADQIERAVEALQRIDDRQIAEFERQLESA